MGLATTGNRKTEKQWHLKLGCDPGGGALLGGPLQTWTLGHCGWGLGTPKRSLRVTMGPRVK